MPHFNRRRGGCRGSLGPPETHLIHQQLRQVRLAVPQLTELLDQRVSAAQKTPELARGPLCCEDSSEVGVI